MWISWAAPVSAHLSLPLRSSAHSGTVGGGHASLVGSPKSGSVRSVMIDRPWREQVEKIPEFFGSPANF